MPTIIFFSSASSASLGAILLPAGIGLIAAAIAIWGVLTQRAMARRRATMDHIAKTSIDQDMINANKQFIALAKDPGGLVKWADASLEGTAEVESIRLVLNDMELISVSIQFGIMDFEYIKRFSHGTIVKYWTASAPLVYALRSRTGSNTIYLEFEQLHEWIAGAKKPKRSIWWKKVF
ncbi:DUF4760 domain-containing protein [Sphingobium sp.]|uniref:DUF4760 domain-containing protein n=1 Tax=Sphingobium sp. TaxID=1912891 RepID=UPI003BB5ABB0